MSLKRKIAGVEKSTPSKKLRGEESSLALLDGFLSNSSTHISLVLQSRDPHNIDKVLDRVETSPAHLQRLASLLVSRVTDHHPQVGLVAARWIYRLLTRCSSAVLRDAKLRECLRPLVLATSRDEAVLPRLVKLEGEISAILGLDSQATNDKKRGELGAEEEEEESANVRSAGIVFVDDSDIDDEPDEDQQNETADVAGIEAAEVESVDRRVGIVGQVEDDQGVFDVDAEEEEAEDGEEEEEDRGIEEEDDESGSEEDALQRLLWDGGDGNGDEDDESAEDRVPEDCADLDVDDDDDGDE